MIDPVLLTWQSARPSSAITLGLFDYIADIFKWNDSISGRTKTAALTFLPPLISCLLFPTGFVTAIGYVGLAATIWTGIIPAMLLYRSRKNSASAKLPSLRRIPADGLGLPLRRHQHCRPNY